LHDLPYTVYTKHRRIFDYVEDTCVTIANIAERFRPGEVYNIAGQEEHDIKYVSDLILSHLRKDDSLVKYEAWEPHTTKRRGLIARRPFHIWAIILRHRLKKA